jgi:hypothetical protein
MFRWLARFGLVPEFALWSPSPKPIPRGERWPSGWWIATVDSQVFPGITHAVVMRGTHTVTSSDLMHEVAWDPSPHPRTRPYLFSGSLSFAALDPAAIARALAAAAPLNP